MRTSGNRIFFSITVFAFSAGFLGQMPAEAADVTASGIDTPKLTLDQTPGVFTPYTWNVAGNEANFFVRDVTAGNTLPFRIRPGAPTNSLLIDATGNVGIGLANPEASLHIYLTDTPTMRFEQPASAGFTREIWDIGAGNDGFFVQNVVDPAVPTITHPFVIGPAAPDSTLTIASTGRVGIGVAAPKRPLHVKGAIRFEKIRNCAAGIRSNRRGDLSCIRSSARFKVLAGALAPEDARRNIMALTPQVGAYKVTPGEPEHWVIAEEAAKVEPAFVGYQAGKPYTVKTQNIVADLIVVVKEQQARIDRLESQLAALQAKAE